MSKLMASISGVRGIFGDSITPEVALRFAATFGVFQDRGRIVVGRDSRTTGPAMFHAVVSGLLSVGCEVVDLGVVSTPTVLLAVEDLLAAGGIAITASHNPAQWNAMKFIDKNGMFLFPERAREFLSLVDNEPDWAEWQYAGTLTHDDDAVSRHIERILTLPLVPVEQIRARRFKVAFDTVNGAGGPIVRRLLEAFDCEILAINEAATGHFAHEPEPLNKNLSQLEDAARMYGADVGFATDPDVDRLALVDEHGVAVGEEFTLLLAEDYVLSQQPGDTVTNLSSSMAGEDIAARYGVKVHRVAVGEINVGKKMLEVNAPIGGEGNGGVICPAVHATRDAPVGIALVLAHMATSGKPLSELVAAIPHYHFAKDKVVAPPEQLDEVMKRAEKFAVGHRTDRTDGIKLLGEGWWVHLRKSGTEPIVRVYVEAATPELAQQLCLKAKTMLTGK
ncbi:MAG: phosphoglucosamine mutase [Candidatus Cloacimonetes bacterium]|nr:phosphoglucosamine mutase [Candidatus Cloacimonadota bacterium]